jgi:hypothetical protein
MMPSREDWLGRMVDALRPTFAEHGHPLPERIRVSCGWPSRSALSGKAQRIGEAWSQLCSADGAHETFLSPVLADPVEVGAVLVHELVHHAVGVQAGHKGPFRTLALAVGLTGPMRATSAGEALRVRLHALAEELGPYPHATLSGGNGKKKQTNPHAQGGVCRLRMHRPDDPAMARRSRRAYVRMRRHDGRRGWRMRFDKSKDPAACVAKDATRYAVQGVAVVERGDATFLAATDGRCLTLVRAYPEDGDDMPSILGNGRIYPPAAFAAARKAAKRKSEATLTLNGAAYVQADGASTEYARVDGDVPRCDWVPAEAGTRASASAQRRVLGEDAKGVRCQRVSRSSCTHSRPGNRTRVLPFTIRPIYLEGGGTDDGSFGVLMPIGGTSHECIPHRAAHVAPCAAISRARVSRATLRRSPRWRRRGAPAGLPARRSRERFAVVYLDTRNRPIAVHDAHVGTCDSSPVHPREVFGPALSLSATSIVVAHNHPSGDPTPSAEDRAVTARLRDAGELLGVRMLDHLVMGDGRYYSFADEAMHTLPGGAP